MRGATWKRVLLSFVITAGALGATTTVASATPQGSPPTADACVGMITAYGDHPEMSPAFFARYYDNVSVQTLMGWVQSFCEQFRPPAAG